MRAAGFAATQVFQPSLLLGNRGESRPAERLGILVGGALGFVFAGPLRRYRPIPAATVAAAMVKAAKKARPGAHVYTYDDMLR